jgi:hypothetical protein
MNFVSGAALGASITFFCLLSQISQTSKGNLILENRIKELTQENMRLAREFNIHDEAFVNLIYDSQNIPRPTGIMAISDTREKKISDVFRKYIDEIKTK